MKIENNYYIFSKNENVPLSKNFNTKEFSCHCSDPSCVEQKINKKMVDILQEIRDNVGFALSINSGFRCSVKQQELRQSGIHTAVGKSSHELGNAVDIAPSKLNDENMKNLFTYCEKYVKAIGTAKTFYHIDLRDDKIRRWTY